MARYGMVIDINKCNGCYNCFLACKDEYTGNDYPPYSSGMSNEGKPWMKVTEKEMGMTISSSSSKPSCGINTGFIR